MSIVKKSTIARLKAVLKPKHNLILPVFFIALLWALNPHSVSAWTIKAPTANKPILVIDTKNTTLPTVVQAFKTTFKDKAKEEALRQESFKRGQLINKLREYLEANRSPLAEHADVLVSTKNWKKIIALANAESTMCRRYPTATANCWGVGGSNLWDFGSSLADGVLGMNKFLNNYPLRSVVKYSDMPFKQMNGLYKQPAANHWLYNVQVVYDELTVLEKSVYENHKSVSTIQK
ncbi:MAG: hypothetical protein KW804_00455 [Candidatus Doudnabacteria bacterium]|nr:hypothetical protein [Candidatus Doudnabacteria bacterium]